MNLKIKEFNVENIKSQLNQDILNLDEDSADIYLLFPTVTEVGDALNPSRRRSLWARRFVTDPSVNPSPAPNAP